VAPLWPHESRFPHTEATFCYMRQMLRGSSVARMLDLLWARSERFDDPSARRAWLAALA